MARLMDQLTGQDGAWGNLERTRKSGRVPHALAFTGSAGAPALELAWAFAQALLCERTEAPCGACPSCQRVANHQSEAVLVIEPEKGVIKLEAAHHMAEYLALKRVTRARVILVNEAHALNIQASNAILKLVEEPPAQTYFLFVTPETALLAPTLRSRLQVIRALAPGRAWSEENRAVGESVHSFLRRSFARDSGAVPALLDTFEDRAAAERAARVLQLLLRDWSLAGSGEELPGGFEFTGWPGATVGARVALWQRACRMEHDLHAHVDRALVFENFYHQVADALD